MLLPSLDFTPQKSCYVLELKPHMHPMLQDAEDDVAPMASVIADRSSGARSASEYTARGYGNN